MNVTWEITKSEQDTFNRSLALFPFLLLLGIVYMYLNTWWGWFVPKEDVHLFFELLPVILVISAFFFISVHLRKTFKYSYKVTDEVIEIQKGATKYAYKWSEFVCFYNYSELRRLSHRAADASTTLFFEMKKPILGRKFVIVHVHSDKLDEVVNFSNQKLKFKKYTNWDDFGLKFYRPK